MYEDLTTFTEIESTGNDYWSQTTTRNTATALPLTDDSYVYKDYGASYFDEYVLYFDFKVTSDNDNSLIGLFAINDNPGSLIGHLDSINGQYVWVQGEGGGQCRLYLRSYDGSSHGGNSGYLNINQTYYVKVYRISNTVYLKIFDTAEKRSNDDSPISTMSGACVTTKHQYLQCGFSCNAGSGSPVSGYCENFSINPGIEEIVLDDTINLNDEIFVEKGIILEDIINLSDEININLSLEKIIETDTISLNDAIKLPPENLILSDTITLGDKIKGIFNAPFTSRIVYGNSPYLILISDSDPVKITKVDISNPIPDWDIYYLNDTGETFKNAKDVTINETFDKIYVACADGKVAKLDLNDLETREEIDTGDVNNLMNITDFDEWTYTYAGTDDSSGEVIQIDESIKKKINTDFRYVKKDITKIETSIDTINAKSFNSDFRFSKTDTVKISSDLRFIKYDYEEIPLTLISRTDFHVYIGGGEVTDVDLESISVTKTADEISKASFRLARKHDNPGVSNQQTVEIKIQDHTIFSGKIEKIGCIGSSENVTIYAKTDEVPEEYIFNSTNLPLASENVQRHLYDVVLNDINIYNPYIDPNDESPPLYKGIKANLGTGTFERVSIKGVQGQSCRAYTVAIGLQTWRRSLLSLVKSGDWQPKQNWTYFWWSTAWNLNLNTSFKDKYIGNSPSSLTGGLISLQGLYAIKQRVWEDLEIELDYIYKGEAPYREISARSGIHIPHYRYSDKGDGLYSEHGGGYVYTNYVTSAVDIEYKKMQNINGAVLPITDAQIDLTIDAYFYYGIDLLTRVSISNTTESNIFASGHNGFPLAVKGITINSKDMLIHLNLDNKKSNFELEKLDELYPDEDSLKYIIPPYFRRVERKYDPATGKDVE